MLICYVLFPFRLSGDGKSDWATRSKQVFRTYPKFLYRVPITVYRVQAVATRFKVPAVGA